MNVGDAEPGICRPAAGESFADFFIRRCETLVEGEHVRIPEDEVPPDFRVASVLIPVWREDGGLRMLLTVRSQNVSSHRGQISFPGGSRDVNDETLVETALRETEEEVAIARDRVRIVGRLHDAWSIHRYLVAPWVGVVDPPVAPEPFADEIDRVIIADVERLMDPEIYRCQTIRRGHQEFRMHAYDYDGDLIWGMTGGLLFELFSRIEGRQLDADQSGANTLRAFLHGADR
jgi:8-oxo-dGTP pyrophosphatase MutT (NUDIX family)